MIGTDLRLLDPRHLSCIDYASNIAQVGDAYIVTALFVAAGGSPHDRRQHDDVEVDMGFKRAVLQRVIRVAHLFQVGHADPLNALAEMGAKNYIHNLNLKT